MDRNLALEATRVTEAAALASSQWMGKGDGASASQAATEAMQTVLDSIYFKGTIVINKGTKMSSPQLFLGENVGCGDDPQIDIALDPLECTESVAFGRSNAMAVILMAPCGKLLALPEIYMEKIAVGPDAAGVIDLNSSVEDNIIRVAKVKNYNISDLTVVILDRERHQELISRVRRMGARIHLIPDGDVAGAVATALPGTGVDILMGIGGASEGVLASGALRCLGGEFQARFVPVNKDELIMADKMGITDIKHIYNSEELAQGDSIMFAATGITDGDLLNGVRYRPNGATTHSLVMRSSTKTRRFIVTDHFFEGKPEY